MIYQDDEIPLLASIMATDKGYEWLASHREYDSNVVKRKDKEIHNLLIGLAEMLEVVKGWGITNEWIRYNNTQFKNHLIGKVPFKGKARDLWAENVDLYNSFNYIKCELSINPLIL